jgi:hypothetical protein
VVFKYKKSQIIAQSCWISLSVDGLKFVPNLWIKRLSHFFLSEVEILKHRFQVKKVHSSGGYGSQGYGYDWKVEEAKKNLLRTHTTAVSARMLYKLAQVMRPGAYPTKSYKYLVTYICNYTSSFYIFVTFYQNSLVGQVFHTHFEPMY